MDNIISWNKKKTGVLRMDKNLAEELLEKLKNGELTEVKVEKEDFLSFREQLVRREDFKHFRGHAKHNGATVFTYMEEPRS